MQESMSLKYEPASEPLQVDKRANEAMKRVETVRSGGGVTKSAGGGGAPTDKSAPAPHPSVQIYAISSCGV